MEKEKYEFIIGQESFVQEREVEVFIPAGSPRSIKDMGPNDSKIYYGYKLKSL